MSSALEAAALPLLRAQLRHGAAPWLCPGKTEQHKRGEKHLSRNEKGHLTPPFPASEPSCCFFQGCFWGEVMHLLQRTPPHHQQCRAGASHPAQEAGSARGGGSLPKPQTTSASRCQTTAPGLTEPQLRGEQDGSPASPHGAQAPGSASGPAQRRMEEQQWRKGTKSRPSRGDGAGEVPRAGQKYRGDQLVQPHQRPRVPKSPRPAAAAWLGAVRRRRSGCFHRPGRRRRTSPSGAAAPTCAAGAGPAWHRRRAR